MNKKKEIEMAHVRRFLSNSQMKSQELNIKCSETPDFIIQTRDKQISIEHTRLIKPKLQETQQYRDKIIKQAQKRFEDKYNEKLYSLITFKNINLKAGKTELENYSKHVFEIVENIYSSNQNPKFRVSLKSDKNWSSELIARISVNNTTGFNHWQHFSAYLVEWIDMDWLQNIIRVKENNIVKYSRNFDENWLLLVADLGTKASANRFDFMDFSEIRSAFDKIFLYAYRQDEICILK